MDILFKWRLHQQDLAKKYEQERKHRVVQYKKEIDDMEATTEYFYKSQYTMQKISEEEYAKSLFFCMVYWLL